MPGSSYKKPGNWATLKRRVIARDGGLCFCGAPALTADHINGVAVGGSHDMDNLRAICQACHEPKSKAEAAAGRRRARVRRRTQQSVPADVHPGVISPDA